MKICVISTTIIPCPPPGYAGLEQLAYQQAEGFAKKGHQVMLVAPKGSIPPPNVTLHETRLLEPEKTAYSGYWQKLPDFDAICDNSWEKWSYILKMEGRLKTPILGILHAPANTMYQTPPPVDKPCLVCISKDQGEEAKSLWGKDIRVAYNGIDTTFYRNNRGPGAPRGRRLLFLARMCRIKGPHLAVEVAEKLGLELDLVGDDTITAEPEYATMLRSKASKLVSYRGPVSRKDAVSYFSQNRALLHMNKEFREPFGLAPVEAQAAGMPVIAFDNGAMRETVNHGKTGFLVSDVKEVEDIVRYGALDGIKESDCVEWASQFRVENMIDRYEELCHEAIAGGW